MNDVQIILGPNTSLVESDNNEENDDNEPYDAHGCYNIFTHKIKFKLDSKSKQSRKIKKIEQNAPNTNPDENSMSGYFMNIMKNIKLSLNGVHIRYEDDFFAQTPFAFGILCDQITSFGSDTEWTFGSLENNQFKRTMPSDSEGILIRETNIINMRVYWKSQAEMFIPNSLYESTKHLEKQIFDAIPLEDMRSLMRQAFADDNLIEPFSMYTNFVYNARPTALQEALSGKRAKIKADILFTKITVNSRPNIVDDIGAFTEYATNLSIMHELKNYRPSRRPVVSKSESAIENEKQKKMKKLVVRDWFFYAIWATRIKMAISTVYKTEDNRLQKQHELNILHKRLIKRMEYTHKYSKWDKTDISELASNANLITQQLDKHKNEDSENEDESDALAGTEFTLRWQNLSLNIFGKDPSARSISNIKKPIVELELSGPCLYFKMGKDAFDTMLLINELKFLDYVKGPPVEKKSINATNMEKTANLLSQRASFAKSPVPHNSMLPQKDRLMTETKEKPMPVKIISPNPKSIKSLSNTQSDEKGTISQRCFLLITEASNLKNSYGLKLSLSAQDAPQNSRLPGKINFKLELGNFSTELSYSLLNNLSECLSNYRELYWFRDFCSTKKELKKGERGIIIENPNHMKSQKNSNIKQLTEKEILNLKKLAQIHPYFEKIDILLDEKDLNFDLGYHNIHGILFDDENNDILTEIKINQNQIKYQRIGEKTQINGFGMNLLTNKPFYFVNFFIKRMIPFIEENSINDFLKEYYSRFNTVSIKAKKVKKSENIKENNNSTAKKISSTTTKISDILNQNTGPRRDAHKSEKMVLPSEALKERMLFRKMNTTNLEDSKNYQTLINNIGNSGGVNKKIPQEDNIQYQTMDARTNDWKKLVKKGKGMEDLDFEEPNEKPVIPLISGENKTNIRLSQLNEKMLQNMNTRMKKENQNRHILPNESLKRRNTTIVAQNPKASKENTQQVFLDLNDLYEDVAPKVNNVLKFPSFVTKSKTALRKTHINNA